MEQDGTVEGKDARDEGVEYPFMYLAGAFVVVNLLASALTAVCAAVASKGVFLGTIEPVALALVCGGLWAQALTAGMGPWGEREWRLLALGCFAAACTTAAIDGIQLGRVWTLAGLTRTSEDVEWRIARATSVDAGLLLTSSIAAYVWRRKEVIT